MKTRVHLTLALLVLVVPALAQDYESSILFLPSGTPSVDGEFSLYADYGLVGVDGRVPIYFINRTNNDIALRSWDGDIYLKLEYQDADGDWVRAQPYYYEYGGCFGGYQRSIVVKAGHFLRTSGYQPINGEMQTIRYQLHSQKIELVSNAGTGVVTQRDIEAAAHDVLTITTGDFETVARLATLESAPISHHQRLDTQYYAIRELASGRFPADDVLKVLKTIDSQDRFVIRMVKRAINSLEDSGATKYK